MKVSELFAEIGFKVDTKGLDEFSKSMKGIQETIKSCVSGLKEFVKAAEQINRAVQNIKNSYIPSQKEAEKRYRAETYYIRSAGKELRGKGLYDASRGEYWAKRASLADLDSDRLWRSLYVREENLALRKKGSLGGESVSIGVTIGTIVGNIISKALHTLLSSLKGFFSSIFSFVRDTIRAAMAYRDYQSFTGRSVNELSGLMGMTAYTTNMTPKDILKDAQSMQKNYWDMWFGRSSPEFWMTIGALPTGNGARDLRTALSGIYNATNKGQNTGMAMSLLSLAGLDEQYMNIFKAMREGRENEFKVMDDEIESMSKANDKLNEFSQAIEQVKIRIVDALLDSGLDELLQRLFQLLKEMLVVSRTKEFKEASVLGKLSMLLGTGNLTEEEKRYIEQYGKEAPKPGFLDFLKQVGTGGGTPFGLIELAKRDMALREFSQPQITNNFDFTNRTTDELADGSTKIMAKEMYLGQREMNNTDATLQTAY